MLKPEISREENLWSFERLKYDNDAFVLCSLKCSLVEAQIQTFRVASGESLHFPLEITTAAYI